MATNAEVMTAGTPVKSLPKAAQFDALFNVITAQVALTEASVAAQVGSQITVTVPGVAFGDFVLISYPADILNAKLSAHVSAANTIKVTLYNYEGTDAVTGMSGGLVAKILVLQPRADFWAQN